MQSTETARMQIFLKRFIDALPSTEEGRINHMMNYSFVECCDKPPSLTISLPVADWMLNTAEIMHGGLMATALDISMGGLAHYLSPVHKTATAQFSVNFIRPALPGDRLFLTSTCHKAGKTMAHINALAVSKRTGEVCASSSGIFVMGFSKAKP
jgi:acyl-CoA thioesterase